MFTWIELERTQPLSNTWQWSDGQNLTFFTWGFSNIDDCVVLGPMGRITTNCSSRCYFCYRSLTFVKENKTWEETLDYCRTYLTTLASLTVNWQIPLDEIEASPVENGCRWPGRRCRACSREAPAQHHVTAMELTTSAHMSGRTETATRSLISSATEGQTDPWNIRILYLWICLE